jgi:hypothetical protein
MDSLHEGDDLVGMLLLGMLCFLRCSILWEEEGEQLDAD